MSRRSPVAKKGVFTEKVVFIKQGTCGFGGEKDVLSEVGYEEGRVGL